MLRKHCFNVRSLNNYLATRTQHCAMVVTALHPSTSILLPGHNVEPRFYQCQVFEVLSCHQGTMLHQGCDNIISLNKYLAARVQHCAMVVIMSGL